MGDYPQLDIRAGVELQAEPDRPALSHPLRSLICILVSVVWYFLPHSVLAEVLAAKTGYSACGVTAFILYPPYRKESLTLTTGNPIAQVGAEYLNPSARLQNCIIQENKRSFTVEFGGENDPIYLMIQIGHVAHDRGISISPIGNEKPQQALALMIFGEMREDSLNKYLGPVAGGKFLSAEFNRQHRA